MLTTKAQAAAFLASLDLLNRPWTEGTITKVEHNKDEGSVRISLGFCFLSDVFLRNLANHPAFIAISICKRTFTIVFNPTRLPA